MESTEIVSTRSASLDSSVEPQTLDSRVCRECRGVSMEERTE